MNPRILAHLIFPSMHDSCWTLLRAPGTFVVNFSALQCVHVCINYVVGCFVGHPVKVSVVMNVYRFALGLFIPFSFEQWIEAGSSGWVFGMVSFFLLFAMILMFFC